MALHLQKTGRYDCQNVCKHGTVGQPGGLSFDNLSSKKLMPGFVFRCSAKLSKSSKWPKLNVVSAESTALCLESAIATYEASPLKKKLLEEKLEMCILVARRLRTGQFII